MTAPLFQPPARYKRGRRRGHAHARLSSVRPLSVRRRPPQRMASTGSSVAGELAAGQFLAQLFQVLDDMYVANLCTGECHPKSVPPIN